LRNKRPSLNLDWWNVDHDDQQPTSTLAYKHYRQAVEKSRELVTSLDTGSSPLLPREIVEEERKVANKGVEKLKQDIQAKDEQLHKAEIRIWELQESGTPPYLSLAHFLDLSQKHCYVMISRRRSNAPKP
jgi:hypothetical protein